MLVYNYGLEQRGSMFIHELREWLMLILEAGIFFYVAKEFYYDKEKDDKKHKRTKTTKKTTTLPSGEIITDEATETFESKGEKHGEQ